MSHIPIGLERTEDGGWLITLSGEPFLLCYPGGTGPCWNIREADAEVGTDLLHVCNLDDLIAALEALKASDAHRENMRRWSR